MFCVYITSLCGNSVRVASINIAYDNLTTTVEGSKSKLSIFLNMQRGWTIVLLMTWRIAAGLSHYIKCDLSHLATILEGNRGGLKLIVNIPSILRKSEMAISASPIPYFSVTANMPTTAYTINYPSSTY